MTVPVVLLAIEREGRLVPLCRVRRREVARTVAAAAVHDAEEAADAQGQDEILEALLRQEAERLRKAFALLGIGPAGGTCESE